MPELPEVETTVNSLHILKNKKVIKLDIHTKKLRYPVPHNKLKNIINSKLINLRRIAKYVIIDLNNSHSIIIHLGMSGRLKILKKDNLINKHDHIVFKFTNNKFLILNDPRKFGFIDVIQSDKINNIRYINRLGLDALDKNLSVKYLYNKFYKSEVLIKQLLLNQYIVAGIGNIYASEILFDAKISPLKKGKDIKKSQIGTIIKSTRKILKKAIRYGGSSINDYVSPDGTLGNFQNNFKVYGMEGSFIRGCQIKKIVLYGRSTFFCPKIQT
ncbi:bifunctional DNA-formamidopyrimidine glycosylase/DNA-(apurinic or apyrimidinic site) lyase [Pelagibacterales bacterium SAG-MED31]|nr:bifunctional DNA-formamidopyrimidine glycosylase/DNA-(apurinic or apyrimidinic site) lyase [Pelagibacterales bacterium SAG-MED31]